MVSDQRFLGKTIVITGAGGNFGREGCIFFASRGANIVALDLNEESLEGTVTEVTTKLTALNLKSENVIKTIKCNVTEVESVDKAMDAAIDAYGSIDMLWNNAGYQGQIKPTLDYDPKDFANVMSINVTGMFIVMQSAAKHMAEAFKNGIDAKFSIVNTASVAGLRGTPAMIAYSSSKAAVLAMTISAAKVSHLTNLSISICKSEF